jgi:hypothetical protein
LADFEEDSPSDFEDFDEDSPSDFEDLEEDSLSDFEDDDESDEEPPFAADEALLRLSVL